MASSWRCYLIISSVIIVSTSKYNYIVETFDDNDRNNKILPHDKHVTGEMKINPIVENSGDYSATTSTF